MKNKNKKYLRYKKYKKTKKYSKNNGQKHYSDG